MAKGPWGPYFTEVEGAVYAWRVEGLSKAKGLVGVGVVKERRLVGSCLAEGPVELCMHNIWCKPAPQSVQAGAYPKAGVFPPSVQAGGRAHLISIRVGAFLVGIIPSR